MLKSTFHISKMDCPSEELLIKARLDGVPGILDLEFDLNARKLSVYHENEDLEKIRDAIDELSLGSRLLATEGSDRAEFARNTNESKALWAVLAINFTFFVIEMATGFFSRSMGLVADSLDMLADSFVYAISLFAVGGSLVRKKHIARLAGYFQIVLALLGFIEVIRRFIGPEETPDFRTMIFVSIFALIANGICLYLLQRSESNEAHMQASMIFTSNDVIINLGVIAAGVLVYLLSSNKPDLVIGTIVFVVVIRGALKILKLGR